MSRRRAGLGLLLMFGPLLAAARCRSVHAPGAPEIPPVPPAEFAALVERLSEPAGVFQAENFVSNETSYLEIAETLADRLPKGGVYLGVGPDQNFNYITRLRPTLAFILDIRRQNLVQHMMFNALFAQAEDPYQFLCRLLARPCPATTPPAALLGMEALLAAVEEAAPDAALFSKNETEIVRHIETVLAFQLTPEDRRDLRVILRSFYDQQLGIRFRGSARPSWLMLPSYRDLLVVRSPNNRYGHYLASLEDYRYLRAMARARRIVPVTGDFAGQHALKAIAKEIAARGETLSAFYLSNVEFYLFRNDVFPSFLDNVKALPLRPADESVMIRACFGFGRPHPLAQPGRISVTLLQSIPRYIALGGGGRYSSDWDVCLADYWSD